MTVNSLLKLLLNVKGAVVDGAEISESADGAVSLAVHVHVRKADRWRCPVCGRKCHVHDYLSEESSWRGMDFGPVAVRIGASAARAVPRARRPRCRRAVGEARLAVHAGLRLLDDVDGQERTQQ